MGLQAVITRAAIKGLKIFSPGDQRIGATIAAKALHEASGALQAIITHAAENLLKATLGPRAACHPSPPRSIWAIPNRLAGYHHQCRSRHWPVPMPAIRVW
jgi:hypothetical protein